MHSNLFAFVLIKAVPGIQVSGFTSSIFRFQLPVNDLKISTENVSLANGSLQLLGMLRVVFNIEAGNRYSNTFIMTLIKQDNLVFILVIYLYIREHLCIFTKLFTGNRVSEDFQFRVSSSRNNRKRTASILMWRMDPNRIWDRIHFKFAVHVFSDDVIWLSPNGVHSLSRRSNR